MKERPCKNCGRTPLHHSFMYMSCPHPHDTQYEPDPNATGMIPYSTPVRKPDNL